MSDEGDSGISRTSISGLFDSRGNPAALASGWLQMVDVKSGRKRHRYVCLCPTYLAYFNDEADADISDEGFMQGDAEHVSLPNFGNHGASIPLKNIYEAQPHPSDAQFTLVLREHLADGTEAIDFHCANNEIAVGWSDAINSQKERYKDVRAPPRLPNPKAAAGNAPSAIAAAGLNSGRALAAEAGRSMMKGFASMMGMKTGDEVVRPDSEYEAAAPWEAKGIDLTSKEAHSCLEDEHGHPAAILCGWLTKRNKSGIYAGSVEKERYFVLTPSALCFYPDPESADVRNGYLWGKAEGEKIGGLLKKTGARLPLESVCEVRLLARASDSRHAPGSPKNSPNKRHSTSASADSDDEDGEEEEEEVKPKKPSGPKPSGSKAGGGKGKGSSGSGSASAAAAGASPSKPPKPDGPPPSNLLEIDFGEYSLIVNAHNQKCRTTWTHGLRKWSGIRKRQVDEELFTGGGF